MQLTIPLAMAAVSFIAAPIIGYYSSQIATAASIAEVNARAAVLEQRATTEEKQLNRVENKVDALLINNGISPTKYNQ